MEIEEKLTTTASGQIALNLDAQDGNGTINGNITKNVWDDFWESHGGDKYKSVDENIGEDGISVEDAEKFVMMRILNYVNSTNTKSKNKKNNKIAKISEKWFNDIKNCKKFDAQTVKDCLTKRNQGLFFNAKDIKINVPTQYSSDEAKSIVEAKESGEFQYLIFQRGNIPELNKDSVAFFVKSMGKIGNIDQRFMRSLFNKLAVKMSEIAKKDSKYTEYADLQELSKQYDSGSFDEKRKMVIEFTNNIIKHNNETIKNDNKKKIFFNNDRKIMQKALDNANDFLIELANGSPRIEYYTTHNLNRKKIKHFDGRWIQIDYNKKGEIENIYISHDTTTFKDKKGTKYDRADVWYTKSNVRINKKTQDDKFIEHEFTSKSYNWDNLVKLTESIIQKCETAEDNTETNS